jgi:hypothetical protein
MKKELFICDGCGARTRLDNTQRHWCALCNQGATVEMRYGKNKKPLILDRVVGDNMLEGAAVRSFSKYEPGTGFRTARGPIHTRRRSETGERAFVNNKQPAAHS